MPTSFATRPVSPQKPIVLMADYELPRADQNSGAADQISFIKIFQALGFEVHYLAISEFSAEETSDLRRYREALSSLGVHCLTSKNYNSHEEYLMQHASVISVAFLSRFHVADALLGAIRKHSPSAKIIFNTVDLYHIRVKREAAVTNNPDLLLPAEAIKQSELNSIANADASIVVSAYERDILRSLGFDQNVFLVPLIREFDDSPIPAFAGRKDIAFLGGYDHFPNVDAVEFFLWSVWPVLHRRRPDIRLLVAGSRLPAHWSSRTDPNVHFVGYVDNLQTFFSKIRLTIAPLRFGAGAKGKVVSSLGEGVPCVASEIAAEGMGLQDGLNISVAKNVDEYVNKIIELYSDEQLWSERSKQGIALIRSAYSLDRGIELMTDILNQVPAPKPKTNIDRLRESIKAIWERFPLWMLALGLFITIKDAFY